VSLVLSETQHSSVSAFCRAVIWGRNGVSRASSVLICVWRKRNALPRRGAGSRDTKLSIFGETGGGLAAVAHDRSLELFYDRYKVIARFVALLDEDPPPRRLLYLRGLGVNGKSLLLRYLAARGCVRLPAGEWARVRRLPATELPGALSGVAKASQVPVARVDFGARPVGRTGRRSVFGVVHAQAAVGGVSHQHAAV
jgi:hypothetical protein